jgi:hypothetical protein
MAEKIALIILGILLILDGIKIFFHRTFDSWKYGPIDIGPYHSITGTICSVAGLIIICMTVRLIYKNKKQRRNKI